MIDAASGLDELVEAFHRLHEHHYAVRANDPVEFTEWNLLAIGHATPEPQPIPAAAASTRAVPSGRRTVFLKEAGGIMEIPIYTASSLPPGARIHGSALVENRLTVALVPPDCTAFITARGGLMIELA